MVKHPCIVCGKPLKIKAKKYCSIQCTGEDRKGKKRPKFFTKAGLQRLADKARIRMKGNKINLGRKGSLAGNKKKSERTRDGYLREQEKFINLILSHGQRI